MSTTIKKRKADEEAEGKIDPDTLGGAWESMKENGPLLFKSMNEYLAWLDEEQEDATEIMAAAYFKAAEMENKFIVPMEFRDFTAGRNKKGEITQITDLENNTIVAKQLDKVLVYSALREKGFKTIIMTTNEGSNTEVLAIPSGVQIEEAADVRGQKDFHKNVRMLYTYKAGTTVYASPENIMGILKLSYVSLSEVSNLMKALNALEAKEDLSKFDAELLVDVKVIQQVLSDHEAKQSRKHFFQTLLAAKIREMDSEQRLNFFKSNPSYTLANNLEFRLPHGGPCYTKLGNKPLAKVPLGSLGPGANVLMSTNILSQKDYKEIVGDVQNYQVFVDTNELGGRKGNKFASMSVKFTEEAQTVLAILHAISTANSSDGNAAASGAPAKKTDGLNVVNLD
jgi:hypothetical protein